jgi:UDP-glucuronate decarboxylase
MQENDGRVVSTFLAQIVRGEPITVYGDGSQTRSFCFVDDLISGLLQLMATPDDFAGPVNLGNPEELSCLALAHRVARVAGMRPSIVIRPLPLDDPRRRRPDIALAARVLGWRPSTPLDEGLRRSLAYYRARLATQSVAMPGKSRGKVTVRDAAMKPVAI